MIGRFKTVETHFIGNHRFRIQERHASADERRWGSVYRVHHQYLGKLAVSEFIAEDMETESGCRLEILYFLSRWPEHKRRILTKSMRRSSNAK